MIPNFGNLHIPEKKKVSVDGLYQLSRSYLDKVDVNALALAKSGVSSLVAATIHSSAGHSSYVRLASAKDGGRYVKTYFRRRRRGSITGFLVAARDNPVVFSPSDTTE